MAKRPAKSGELKVESWPIDKPEPYPLNPRKISAAAIDKVAVSIKAFGFQQPIVVDKHGVVVVGHTRLAAAAKLGFETVPVVVASKLSPDQAKAYRLADNRTGEESTWDLEILPLQMGDLNSSGFDLRLTGFDDIELGKFVPGFGSAGEPEAPESFGRIGDNLETEHECPKCGYEWSGKAK